MKESPNLLLDTCVMLFAAGDEPLRPAARTAIEGAAMARRLLLSPVSAWEIGLLMSRGRLKSQLSAIEFFDQFLMRSSCAVCDVTPAIFANSSYLPNFPHRDPADCLMIATARTFQYTLVTRDKTILDYGAEGYVNTLAC